MVGGADAALSVGVAAVALVLAGCAGAGDGGGGAGSGGGVDGGTLNVLVVGNPQTEDIQKLTARNFTEQSGVKVNFTILPENELRDKVMQDLATSAGQYDVATIGAYEVPIWAKNGWLHELSSYAQADANFDSADLLPPITKLLSGGRRQLYACSSHDSGWPRRWCPCRSSSPASPHRTSSSGGCRSCRQMINVSDRATGAAPALFEASECAIRGRVGEYRHRGGEEHD